MLDFEKPNGEWIRRGWQDKRDSYKGVTAMEIPFDDDEPCGPGECGPEDKRKTKVRNHYKKCETGYIEKALKLAKDGETYDIKKFPVDITQVRKEMSVQ